MEREKMGYIVGFSTNDSTIVIGEGYGLTKITADRMVEDLERQGIAAIIQANDWMF
ncbi:MAG: hypothetical protein PHX74_12015 [Candidatus Sumerlaeales bacterium]|nr:hypothetical protein [Candidatus Sumerlaeales bacterium]